VHYLELKDSVGRLYSELFLRAERWCRGRSNNYSSFLEKDLGGRIGTDDTKSNAQNAPKTTDEGTDLVEGRDCIASGKPSMHWDYRGKRRVIRDVGSFFGFSRCPGQIESWPSPGY